jgi:hypothetical protein
MFTGLLAWVFGMFKRAAERRERHRRNSLEGLVIRVSVLEARQMLCDADFCGDRPATLAPKTATCDKPATPGEIATELRRLAAKAAKAISDDRIRKQKAGKR